MRAHPDISDIIARKTQGRRALAALPFAEKIEIVEQMRAQVEPLRQAREARKAAAASSKPNK